MASTSSFEFDLKNTMCVKEIDNFVKTQEDILLENRDALNWKDLMELPF